MDERINNLDIVIARLNNDNLSDKFELLVLQYKLYIIERAIKFTRMNLLFNSHYRTGS